MSEIIFLMWLSDISASMGFVCGIVVIFWGFAFAVLLIKNVVDEDFSESLAFLKFKKASIAVAVVAAIGCLLPSKITMHSIVALKAGEEISKTALGSKACAAIDSILDKIISENTKK